MPTLTLSFCFPFCARFFFFCFFSRIPGRIMVLGGTENNYYRNLVLTSFLCFFFTCSQQASAPAQGRFFYYFFLPTRGFFCQSVRFSKVELTSFFLEKQCGVVHIRQLKKYISGVSGPDHQYSLATTLVDSFSLNNTEHSQKTKQDEITKVNNEATFYFNTLDATFYCYILTMSM